MEGPEVKDLSVSAVVGAPLFAARTLAIPKTPLLVL